MSLSFSKIPKRRERGSNPHQPCELDLLSKQADLPMCQPPPQRKGRELNPQQSLELHSLSRRSDLPMYQPSQQSSVDLSGLNPNCTVRRTGILPLEHRPIDQAVPRPGVEPGPRL